MRAKFQLIIELDFKFHRLIYHETQNNQLGQLLERLLSHFLRFWLTGPQEIKPETFFTEAMEIIQALKTKDEVRLKAASADYIKVSLDTILDLS